MIVLDTDHVSVLAHEGHPQREPLLLKMRSSVGEPFAITAVSVEETTRGWLGFIARTRDLRRQVSGYDRLVELVKFLGPWDVMPFDEAAADEVGRLRRQGVRIGTQDLKIAAIALTTGALLLSANLRDFRQVPGLRVENWLV